MWSRRSGCALTAGPPSSKTLWYLAMSSPGKSKTTTMGMVPPCWPGRGGWVEGWVPVGADLGEQRGVAEVDGRVRDHLVPCPGRHDEVSAVVVLGVAQHVLCLRGVFRAAVEVDLAVAEAPPVVNVHRGGFPGRWGSRAPARDHHDVGVVGGEGQWGELGDFQVLAECFEEVRRSEERRVGK